MNARPWLTLFLGFSAVHAQPIEATDALIQPTNPPQNVAPRKDVPAFIVSESSKKLLPELAQANADLKSALNAGLAENHPTVKAIRARLDALQGQIVIQSAPKSEQTEMERLKNEVREMKSELEKLKKEMERLKNEK